MKDQRPGEQVFVGMTTQELQVVEERLNKALEDYRGEMLYEFRLFLNFPTDGNQQALQDMCTRYRHLWMRAHDELDEVEEDEEE